ncbi:MAG TPA: aconitase/3-isopropylmalate dehydratase large subunit family protein [Bacteroidales bacterium]|nr:aconitase/3-isopropylmalate dehydratase large subunit family protein [Bacteroidales bacterium]
MTLLEKILASHSKYDSVKPGEIVDIKIDVRIARDFGGANVVKNILDHNLGIDDPRCTFFTFDCNPGGSDQKYAVNQHICRQFARNNGIKVYDIDSGIGTHIAIDEGLIFPGATAVSTDSHANILGAIGAFGQGMGDMDIAAAWSKGRIWFRVPPSARINLTGALPAGVSAKDLALNLLSRYGANSLLGFSVEIYGDAADKLSLDQRITISSMATEMGAIIILFPPDRNIIDYCTKKSGKPFRPVYADNDAKYSLIEDIDVSRFERMVSRPGAPHDTADLKSVNGIKIDSAFIGSCTNGRIEDMQKAAAFLHDRRVAPGVVLKIVPATDSIWRECLTSGLLDIFKRSGALVSNAGCAGCAAGQVGQNGQGEITISTGNRNFPGKQGKGSVYLASPEIVAASAVAGCITDPGNIPEKPVEFKPAVATVRKETGKKEREAVPVKNRIIEGKIWLIRKDNIDTDMIFHNRYLAITDIREMGQYTFDNLEGNEDFAKKASPGDIIVTGKNFGSGSSRQQAVDCFISLGIAAIVAESFGAIYERNAINAALPVITCRNISDLSLNDGDNIKIDLVTGEITNLRTGLSLFADPFSEVQYEIYQNGGLF